MSNPNQPHDPDQHLERALKYPDSEESRDFRIAARDAKRPRTWWKVAGVVVVVGVVVAIYLYR